MVDTGRRRSSADHRSASVGGGLASDSDDHKAEEGGVTNIKVAVRCRPMSSSERARAEQSCFRIENRTACLENPANRNEVHRFAFDLLYGGDTKQQAVWNDVGVPALEKAFAGFNTTIFAYGQTGSGKTFSMQGEGGGGGGRGSNGEGDADGDGAGIIPRMNEDLFIRVARERHADANKMFLVTCSYFEIYNEVVYDLLDPNNRKKKGAGLEIREHGVLGIYVKGLQEMVVTSPDSMKRLIDQGMASRTVGSTAMNDNSSRSHSVFTVKVHQKDATDESKSTFAKINLVDLAGSERAKSTGATGARLKEGANINKSLSSLGNVINALVEVANGKKGIFVPYRNSKLTRVLQESLGGNSLTAMLAALSPAACNFEETLSTLKYASRAKSIKVNAVRNEEASQVSRLEEEIRLLKRKLATQQQQQQQQEQEQRQQQGQQRSQGAEASASYSVSLDGSPSSSEAFVGGGKGDGDGDGTGGRGQDAGSVRGEDVEGGDRYKQQIAEMEAAMRSTWEEKSKQSESSERERQRLQQQLEEEARREERERKKRWRALEDKGDLELSIREAKEVALPTLPASDWLAQVRALVAAESRVKEEATVCAVYREALARELEQAFSEKDTGDENDVAISSSSSIRVGNPGDDRAPVASTACTGVSENGILSSGVDAEKGGVAKGRGGKSSVPGGVKNFAGYEPTLLRQLQARLTSLRDARERLHGSQARAVEERSKNLLKSVEAFAAMYAASPHEMSVDGSEGSGKSREAGVRTTGSAEGLGGADVVKRRLKARKAEGARALAMIRRQVLERKRSWRADRVIRAQRQKKALPQRRSREAAATAVSRRSSPDAESSSDVTVSPQALPMKTLSRSPEVAGGEGPGYDSGGNNNGGGGGGADDLCPAASVLLRAVEGVLSAEYPAVTETASEEDDGGEGDRARYLEALDGLQGARDVLRAALNSAAEQKDVGQDGPAADGDSSTSAIGRGNVIARRGEKGASQNAPRWEFQCSSRGCARVVDATDDDVTIGGKERPETDDKAERVAAELGGACNGDGGSGGGRAKHRRWGKCHSCTTWFTWSPDKKDEPISSRGNNDEEPIRSPDKKDGPIRSRDNNDEEPIRSLDKKEELAAGGREDGEDDDVRDGSTPAWVEVDFGEAIPIASLMLQPIFTTSKAPGGTLQLEKNPVMVANFGRTDVDGSVEKTVAMVGEVIVGGWKSILKSTPPAKLLSRPPVRFLFDLFKAIAGATGFGEELARDSKWEDFPGKKEKTRLMDGIAGLVADAFDLETPPAKGSDIVIGQECVATNRLLQLLALASRKHALKGEGEAADPPPPSPTAYSWAEQVSICTSEDGVTWQASPFVDQESSCSSLATATTVITLSAPLSSSSWPAKTTRCRYLKLTAPERTPRRSSGSPCCLSDGATTTTTTTTTLLRVGVVVSGVCTVLEGEEEEDALLLLREFHKTGEACGWTGGDRGEGQKESSSDGRQEQERRMSFVLLDGMRSVVDRLLLQSQELGRIEAANQERKTAMRTNKMESLEKRLKASDDEKIRLVNEKKGLYEKATRTEEDNLRLQEELLRLTADVGRERVEKASVAERLGQAEARVEEEKARVRVLEELKAALDGEAEDMQNQVEVLTEERDVARAHEEELFAKLTDKVEDLEALQESYVSLTDRWNDFQDEYDELLEQMERYRTTLALSGVQHPPPPDITALGTAAEGPGHSADSTDGTRRAGEDVKLSPNKTSGGDESGPRSFGRTFEGGAMNPSEYGSARPSRRDARPGMGGSGGAASIAQQETPRSSRRTSSGRRSSPRKSSLPPTPSSTPTRTPQSATTTESRGIDSDIWMEDTGKSESSRRSKRRGCRDNDDVKGFNDADRDRPGEQGGGVAEGGFTFLAIGVGGSGQAEGSSSSSSRRRRSRRGKRAAAGSQEERAYRTSEASPGVAEKRTSSRGGDYGSCGDYYYEDDFDDFLEDEEECGQGAVGDDGKKRWQQQQHQQSPQNDVMGSPILTVPSTRADPEGAEHSRMIRHRSPADDAGRGGNDEGGRCTRSSFNDGYQRSPAGGRGEVQAAKRDDSNPPNGGGRPHAGQESSERRRKQEDHDGATSRVEVVYHPPSGSSRNATKGERPKSAARQGRAASFNNNT